MDDTPDANSILQNHGVDGLRHASDKAKTITASDLLFADKQSFKPNGWAKAGAPNGNVHRPSILSSAEFVEGFVPPNYVIDGILQRNRLYSCTAKTGHGKTAITLRVSATIAKGLALGGHGVERGQCLMLCGENPDDVCARWIATCEQMGFFPDELGVHFIAGVFPITELLPLIERKAAEVGGFAFVAVDTGAAYFDGDDDNVNVQMGDYARVLRQITAVPGRPCVWVNMHPPKNATRESLLPRGGGAFLNEVDGNLCCWITDKTVELHWQGKFRGPDFKPINFEMVEVTSTKLVDSKDRPLPTVYAKPMTDAETASNEFSSSRDKQTLIVTMAANPGVSIADLATKAGWVSSQGKPAKSKVHRLLETLKAQKLAVMELDAWVLTPSGRSPRSSPAASHNDQKRTGTTHPCTQSFQRHWNDLERRHTSQTNPAVPLERGPGTEGGSSPPFRRSVPVSFLSMERGTITGRSARCGIVHQRHRPNLRRSVNGMSQKECVMKNEKMTLTLPVATPVTRYEDGGCPICGESNGYLDLRDWTYSVCDAHKAFWPTAQHTLAGNKANHQEAWRAHFAGLASYTLVEPIYPIPKPDCVRCGRKAGRHSSFCQYSDGTLTLLSDEMVLAATRHEDDWVRANPNDEIPF